ncbi:MAG: XdhC family protein [Cyanobacteria bacterium NC_groundwater_1444_Ag_S-0.65um_54_12]|nr:XdhC family protein [Cyanobacteria bacterium NC_groundwater_1444_Ag_S-0.65um_54_12]
MKGIITALCDRLQANLPCALATIVRTTGSIPNAVGAKMLVDPAGKLLAGTIGGGAFEYAAIRQCVAAIGQRESRLYTWTLTEAQAGGIGMLCGGTAEVFIEIFATAALLVLVGGGHVNIQVWRLARELGFRGVVIDDRGDWANAENFPDCQFLQLSPAAAFAQITWDTDSFVVIGTRDQDTAALRAAALQDLPCRLIGMISSKRKTWQILKELQREGLDLARILPRFHSPIGLDLGKTKSPAAVALSIVAELQTVRQGGTGRSLSIAQEWSKLPKS